MKSILKRLIATIGAVAFMLAPAGIMTTAATYAQASDGSNCTTSGTGTISDCVCSGVVQTGSDGCTDSSDSGNSFAGLAKKIINIFSIVVGAVSVVMIIIGGFRYIISGGDSGGVTGAKNTILYAIVGLVIVLFAQVIVRFVLTNVSGS